MTYYAIKYLFRDLRCDEVKRITPNTPKNDRGMVVNPKISFMVVKGTTSVAARTSKVVTSKYRPGLL